MRLSAQSGDLDLSFDTDGIVHTALSPDDDFITAITSQPDSKILVAGYYYVSNSYVSVIVRYNTDGSLDSTFDNDGIIEYYNKIVIRSIAVQADGKILGVGGKYNGITTDFAILRYNSDGSVDNSWGANGLILTNMLASGGPSSVHIQADGKIVLAGTCISTNQSFACAARYNTDGTLDNTYGVGGIAKADSEYVAFIHYSTMQPDNKVIVGWGGINHTALARFTANGSVDNTFNGVGIVNNWNAPANSIALQANGKIITSGSISDDTQDYFQLTCYNSDGSLDMNFGDSGFIKLDAYKYLGLSKGLITQPDEKIIAGGISYGKFAMIRFLPNGDFDTAFGDSGRVYTEVGGGGINALHFTPNGKILAGGSVGVTGLGGTSYWAIARYHSGLSLYLANPFFDAFDMHIFPNPTNGILNLQLAEPLPEEADIAVYTSEGKEVYRTKLRKQATDTRLYLYQLPQGMYECVLRVGGNKLFSNSFLKLN